MMGLGNGRRTMKSPPLVLAALVACIIVLGFNYWIASSRSVDLQTRIMELEGRVRRAAAERGAVELKKNEFQGELEKQREQLDKIQSSHNFQMESVNKRHTRRLEVLICVPHRVGKAVLVNNITSSERLIRTLQDQFQTLQKNYGKLYQDVLQFQKNQTNLERKFSYDLSQCINQMKEVKEQCEERIEEVTKKGNEAVASRDLSEKKNQGQQIKCLVQEKDESQCINQMKEVKEQCEERIEEVTKKGNEAVASRDLSEKKNQGQQLQAPSEPKLKSQEAALSQSEEPQAKANIPSNGEPQTPVPSSETVLDLKRQVEKEETSDIQVLSEGELRRDSLGLPPAPDQEQAVEEDRHAGGKGMGDAGGLGLTPQVPAALVVSHGNQNAEDLEQDQLVIRDGQEEEQDADKQERNQKLGGDDEYNMDENEAESETDKQAALAGNDRNVNDLNVENQKRDMINLLDQREKRNHTL
ncbi:Golgi membrane protein 1 [Pteropus alecto]|uniref:Golgi membrane protein 1 n=1 Tax=Pteropus alecto TaxID=9402 RepID=L5KCM7_PTEAL|nr:Golgi membrane protein 1 [Pteropus alecto]